MLYSPWLPTLLTQAQHTGAPWSTKPSFHELFTAPGAVLGGDAPFVAFVVTAAAGLAVTARRTERVARRARRASTVLAAWVASQISPAWTTRYFAVVLGPAVLLAAAAIVRAGGSALVALVVVLFLWWGFSVKDDKENAQADHGAPRAVAAPRRARDLDASRAGAGAALLPRAAASASRRRSARSADAQVFDWRDAVDRLEAPPAAADARRAARDGASAAASSSSSRRSSATTAPGRRRWTRLVWRTAERGTRCSPRDPRLQVEHHIVTDEIAVKRNYFKPLQAVVYRRIALG